MDLRCGSVSSDELDEVISSSTEASSGRILLEEQQRNRQEHRQESEQRNMDDQDVRSGSGDGGKPLTPAQELRKATKPLMEKRRRARINQCLQELKDLILEALNKDPARHNKLEKADILEMAVCHLKSVQRQVRTSPKPPQESTTKYRDGYTECANEVSRFVNNVQVLQPDVKQKLIGHLSTCLNTLDTSNGAPDSPPLGYPLAQSPSSQVDQQGPLPPLLPSGDRSSSPLSYSPYPPLSPSSHRSSPPLPAAAASFAAQVPLNLSPAQLVAFPGMIPPPASDLNNNAINHNVGDFSINSSVLSSRQVSTMPPGVLEDEPMDDEVSPAEDDAGDAPLDFSKKVTLVPVRTDPVGSISSTGGGGYGGGTTCSVFPNPRKKYLASVSSGASSSSEESASGTTPQGSVSSTTELDFHHASALQFQQQQQLHQYQPVNYSKNVYGGASAPRCSFAGDSELISEDDDDVWRPWNFQ